jgi:predicted GNAT family acetyltransferase
LLPPCRFRQLSSLASRFGAGDRLDLAKIGAMAVASRLGKGVRLPMGNDPPAPPRVPVRHDPDHSRFFLPLAEGDAELIYAPFSDDVLDLQHTEVPPSGEGRGIGDALVRAALAYAREQRMRVMATCPYVQAWLRRHPEERPS